MSPLKLEDKLGSYNVDAYFDGPKSIAKILVNYWNELPIYIDHVKI